jgi:hypothetical protein
MAFAIFSARIRIPLLAVAGLMILLGVVTDRLWVSNVGFVALIIGLGALFPSGHGTQRATCRTAACRRPLGTSEQPRHPRTEPRLTCLGPDLRNRSCLRCQPYIMAWPGLSSDRRRTSRADWAEATAR